MLSGLNFRTSPAKITSYPFFNSLIGKMPMRVGGNKSKSLHSLKKDLEAE